MVFKLTKTLNSDNILLARISVFILDKINKGVEKMLSNVRKEMKKVKWPNKKDMIKYSIATLTIILFFGLFFTASDLIIAGIKEIMK